MKRTTTHFKTVIALLSLAIFILLLAVPAAFAQSDTEPPTDVENVKAVAGNTEVSLSWNVATDNNLVKGYKIYYGENPVLADGDVYEFDPIDVKNKITFTVDQLENGTTYYFAITAYDEAGNESINYSVEVSATPSQTASDTIAPTVKKAEALSKNSVVVTFSEAVKLPSVDATSAFGIIEDGSGIELDIVTVVMNPEDITDKSVSIVTADQLPGKNYIVTAGIQIKDMAGNPIESGTSDTAVFTGTDVDPFLVNDEDGSTNEVDTAGPLMVNLTVPDSTHLTVEFDEPVVLSDNPENDFLITYEEDLETSLEITSAVQSDDKLKVDITTAEREARNYNLIVLESVKDEEGNLSDIAENATVFFGMGDEEEVVVGDAEDGATTDETGTDTEVNAEGEVAGEVAGSAVDAPEDVTDLTTKLLEGMIVSISWAPSINTMGDLAGYVIYKSMDGKMYENGVVLAADADNYRVSGLIEGTKYWYKIAAQDADGNESLGKVTSFVLPATGPELGFLLAGALGLGRFFKRKKRK